MLLDYSYYEAFQYSVMCSYRYIKSSQDIKKMNVLNNTLIISTQNTITSRGLLRQLVFLLLITVSFI